MNTEDCQTVVEALRLHALNQPNASAFTFLESDSQKRTLTFTELDARARSLATAILGHAEPGDRALLTFKPGLEFIAAFFGCLYAGIVAVPAYVPKRNRNAERVISIARDSKPRLLLCSSDVRQSIVEMLAFDLEDVRVIAINTCETLAERQLDLPAVQQEKIALLQYTSGSTASPKGVVITHASLWANELSIRKAFEHSSQSVVCGWLPTFHDMGLIGIVLQPLILGVHSILMSPASFLEKPVRWLRAISDYGVTTSGAPNFGYEHCVKLVKDSECDELDLSSWKVAFNGAEPVRIRTIESFVRRFERYGFSQTAFFPCYGLAEATLFVSGGPVGRGPRHELIDVTRTTDRNCSSELDENTGTRLVISCGRVASSLDAAIVSPDDGQELPEGSIGEIWVAGDGIADGYWNNGDQTDRIFHAALAGRKSRFVRTGDLGFMRNGELFVTGRLSDLIKLRGQNFHPHDIELVVEQTLGWPLPNTVAAFSIEAQDRTQLAVIVEATRTIVAICRDKVFDRDESAHSLASSVMRVRAAVSDTFGIRVDIFGFVTPGKFPRTSSGKVQRNLCKLSYLSGDLKLLTIPDIDRCVAEDSFVTGHLTSDSSRPQ
jgi:acyl-CoA synthetase (AMP-forming)/AMP-acid ligase II